MSKRGLIAIAVYALLSLCALVWGLLRGNLNLYAHPTPWLDLPFPYATLVSVLMGLMVASVVIVSTPILVAKTGWAKALHTELRGALGPLSRVEILVYALASGIGEELFFRGAMQPGLGWVLSSLIFGFVHIGPSKKFLPWTLWATLMGFVFGAIFAVSGELLGCIVAHALINHENLSFIGAYDPEARNETPPLVS